MYPLIEVLTHRSRRWQVGAGGLLLLILLATCGLRQSATNEQVTDLPQPVIDSLSQQPVWCYAEFSDGRMESVVIAYYPAPLDEVFARYGYDPKGASIAKQMIRCYASWQAAFTHEGTQPSSKRSEIIKALRADMPATPNEADYEVAVLYSLFNQGWKQQLDIRFSPAVTPQPWRLTQGQETTLKPRR